MSKVELVRKKYSSIPSRTFNSLVNYDETDTKKYLDYMCFVWTKCRSAKQTKDIVSKFDSLLPYIDNKDIYSPQYRDYDEFLKVITQAEIVKEEKSFNREEHVDVILENDDFILLIPKTHVGSLKYGANTKWCTTSKYHAGTFQNYASRGFLFYLIRKKQKNDLYDKVAFFIRKDNSMFSETEVYKSNDVRSDTKDFMNSSWEYSDIQKVMTSITLYCMDNERFKNAKNTLENFVRTIKNIDIEKISKSFEIVGKQSVDVEGLEKKIEELTEGVSKLKFTY